MRVAIYDDNGLVDQVFEGQSESVAEIQRLNPNTLVVEDDVVLDFDKPIIVKDGEIQPQLEATDAQKNSAVMEDVRAFCKYALDDSDKWMLSDRPDYISSKASEWANYRQQLRDFPATVSSTVTDIADVDFPQQPSFT